MRIESGQRESFENTQVWQAAKDITVAIYKITKTFPDYEQFGITNQLRRAATSVSANLAEGYGRESRKDKLHFYTIAYGSLLETKSFLLISVELGYVNDIMSVLNMIENTQTLIGAIKKKLKSHEK